MRVAGVSISVDALVAAGGAEGSLGHKGCESGLRNERVSQCEVLREPHGLGNGATSSPRAGEGGGGGCKRH